MHIVRTVLVGVAGLALTGLVTGSWAAEDQSTGKPAGSHTMPMPARGMTSGASTMTREQKIANALSAAPASVSAKATILDWPAKEGEAPSVLRAGTNGWSCLSDMPDTNGNDPMCLDGPWMKWVEAYMSKTAPKISSVGIGYMMAPGGSHGSNTDPYAMAETAGNQWAHHPPHMMIVVPDLKTLEGISTDPHHGGPYVMYKGTPYAHIMAPTTPATMSGH
jgi:hypothetical protein